MSHGALSQVSSDGGLRLANPLHPLPELRIIKAIDPLPYASMACPKTTLPLKFIRLINKIKRIGI
jgi:hypothetical protein